MGVKKECKIYRDCYLGSLSEKEADIILEMQDADVIEDLKNCIYDLDESALSLLKTYRKLPDGYVLPRGELRDYQTVGVATMYFAKRMLLGDATGLGKTPQAAGLINLISLDNHDKGLGDCAFIFFAEKKAVPELRDKLMKFTAQYVTTMTGNAKDINAFVDMNEEGLTSSVVASHSVCTNPKFLKWLYNHKGEFDICFMDESSIVKNTTSTTNSAAKEMGKWFNYYVFLNATPVELSLREFYNQLNILDSNMMPTISAFEDDFVERDYSGFRSSQKYVNELLFRQRIRLRYIANTRKKLGATFEGNTGELIISELSVVQKRLLNKTSMWRMACDCPTYLDSSVSFNEINIPKLANLEDLFNNKIPEDESVYLYCYYKETQYQLQEWLNKRGINTRVMNGETRQKEDTKALQDFNNKMYRVLVSNTQKSLDLLTCNHVVFFSFDYNPMKMLQVEGRIVRDFDVKQKTVYLLCSEGRELKYVEKTLSKRLEDSARYSEADDSLIMKILLENKERILKK